MVQSKTRSGSLQTLKGVMVRLGPLVGPTFLLLVVGLASADPLKVAWEKTDGIEQFVFDTEQLTGTFVARDTRDLKKGMGRHGLRGLAFGPSQVDLHAPEGDVGQKRRHQGHLNLYRVYAGSRTFGALRDDLAELERLDDGARLTWPASDSRPVHISATWRLTGLNQIDLTVEATPAKDLENFEILPASYCPVEMTKLIYVKGDGGPKALKMSPPSDLEEAATYPFFPLTEEDRSPQQDSGRISSEWKWPTTVREELAGLPVVVAHDRTTEILLLGDPESVSAVCATPRRETGQPEQWNSVEKHSALYLSLFCRDVKAGETLSARVRWIAQDRADKPEQSHRQLYGEFLREIVPAE